MEYTKITSNNYHSYYQQVYKVSTYSADQLLDISAYKNKKIAAIDSCGWHYQQTFGTGIIKIENLHTVKDYRLENWKFDRLFNSINSLRDTVDVVLLDHCPTLFKYKTPQEVTETLATILENTRATQALIRLNTTTLLDNRLADRFVDLSRIIPVGFVVEYYNYSISELSFVLRKKQPYVNN